MPTIADWAYFEHVTLFLIGIFQPQRFAKADCYASLLNPMVFPENYTECGE